eukprot:TRINITY_DN31337_c0_g4_i1.p1 TRINITY_DN31337_c0_g4~~TRINITY_DN31337_c0_g4_i1.p1  ORF type:complete len:273 (-),score=33.22 TRINITY_DN31337_c0_g4_i1:174-938(-)
MHISRAQNELHFMASNGTTWHENHGGWEQEKEHRGMVSAGWEQEHHGMACGKVPRISTYEVRSKALSSPAGESGNLGGFEHFRRSPMTAHAWLDCDAGSRQEMTGQSEVTALPRPPGLWMHRSRIETNQFVAFHAGIWTAADESNHTIRRIDPIDVMTSHESIANLPGPPQGALSMQRPLPVLSANAVPGLQAWDLPPEVPSVGTVGHPLNCSAPCKFYRKARGCLQGRQCTRCHLCFWTRKGSKNEHPGELRL